MHRTKRLLMVEDNSDDRELTRLALEKSGVSAEIDVVRDGAEALDYLFGPEEGGSSPADRDLPALILLDLEMPRVDGLEVLRRIRSDERTRLLPVVILSSSSLDDRVNRGYRLGVNSFVRKPVDFSEYESAVGQIARYWLQLNETAVS